MCFSLAKFANVIQRKDVRETFCFFVKKSTVKSILVHMILGPLHFFRKEQGLGTTVEN